MTGHRVGEMLIKCSFPWSNPIRLSFQLASIVLLVWRLLLLLRFLSECGRSGFMNKAVSGDRSGDCSPAYWQIPFLSSGYFWGWERGMKRRGGLPTVPIYFQ